ncbi:hypothetical protein [Roseovarius atlanticus]|uniref:hypothetical protein n=1 Tax=Roseovarius atlanticus TaxID=1641875 RepID=UPI001C96AB37|nr:hypothetical protein [Roseovarius atlanticus]MBY5987091.1 hypothetical protein [Roseovarius atlanticus]MBY6125731.1 hypothetical protein [Roseovarius atlanticus]MBY6149808.1 hypothetical protein [Roseovarius atlanticus]
MDERYVQHDAGASSEAALIALVREFADLPEIMRLDECAHFHCQLKVMRARGGPHIRERFFLEMAVLLRLHEYDGKLGLPLCEMPLGDGLGGLVEVSPVPEEWR